MTTIKRNKELPITLRILLLLAFASIMSSTALQAQTTLFNLSIQNKTYVEAIREIEKNSDYIFFYSDGILDPQKKVSIVVKDQEINEILKQLFGTGISYKIDGRQIFLATTRTDQEKNQKSTIKINGTIRDSEKNLISGASVHILGSKEVTISDFEGNYYLDIPSKDTYLVFNYIGLEEQVVSVGNQLNINVTLKQKTSELDEVVVTGFGSQRKLSVIGSITTIEPEKLKQGTTRSLSNNLGGQLSGIIAVQRSGEPGYDNSNFWIRGISTFKGARSPLVLIDGIERSLNNIDPEEIASFSILKDASASAVYGVRGANGVIIITTKRGEVSKPKLSIRFEQGYTQPVKLPQFIGSADYLEVLNSVKREAGKPELYDQELIDKYRNKVDPDLYPDVNWLDAITEDHASNTRANFNVIGGSEVLRYALVASYYGENGIISRDQTKEWNSSMKLQRYNMRSNVDVNLTPTTLMRFNIGGYLQDRNTPATSIDELFNSAFENPPFVHPTQYSSGEIPRRPERSNPWARGTQTGFERHSASQIETLFSIDQNLKGILPGLKTRLTFSFDRYSNNWVKRSKEPDYYNPATGRLPDGSLDLQIASYGQAYLGHEKGQDWGNKSMYGEGNISYVQNFGKNYIDVMAMYNQRHYDDGDKLPFRNQGMAGRLSYSYDRRYVAEVNFGYNGSENFAKGKRFGFFPSAAIGWLLSEEPFMIPYKQKFSKIKFRASYGLVGNDKIDGRRFSYITTVGDTNEYKWGVDNDYHRAGRREGDYGVPNLTWETVAKSNFGLELGLFNCLDIQLDYFKEKRKDIFMERQTIPGSAGFINAPWANFGKVNNQGFETSIDFNKQFNKDLYISIRGTFTYAKNKIIEQDEALSIIGTNRARTGTSVGQLFGLEDLGLFTDDDFVDIPNGVLKSDIPRHSFGPVRPGDIKYKDVNADGIVDDLDQKPVGKTWDPEIVYGFGASIRYINVDFSFFFQGIGNTTRFIGGGTFIPGSVGGIGNILTNVEDRWTVEQPRQNVFYPRLAEGSISNNQRNSTWWLRDMSLIRLKNIEIGYNMPKQLMSKLKISHARFFLRGSNLLTFSKFKLWDPEVEASNGLKYPIMKSFSFGLELNF